MKHPHLPQYFAIKRDENNPLWEEYIQWLNDTYKKQFEGRMEAYFGVFERQGVNWMYTCSSMDKTELITLEEWKQAIDKTEDMKEKTIENYNLDYPEAARIIHLYLTEFCDPSLTFPNMIADASRKASSEIDRLRTIKDSLIVQPEFDPTKPVAVSFDNGETWDEHDRHFIGYNSTGHIVVEYKPTGLYQTATNVRNIEPFTAAMLEVGEYLETEGGENIIRRISEREFFDIKNTGLPFYIDLAKEITGKRVKVNITTEEI